MRAIAAIPGDGTGPEVVAEAIKCLEVAAVRYDIDLEFHHYDVGADRYLRTGETIPDAVLEELQAADAILFGAVGHPNVAPGILEQGIVIRIRRELDQYVNLRPVHLYPTMSSALVNVDPDDIDMVVVRENTEGLYVDQGRVEESGTDDEKAIQESINTARSVARCIRYAFELARKRPRHHLTLVGKTNVLTHAWGLWNRVFDDVASEFSDVETTYAHVDAAAYWMVDDPGRFDVIVTDNMFGDIISDLGAAIGGGLGIAAGGNINPHGVSMFEPIGGTAPGYEGTGKINPLAAIRAGSMMMHELGHLDASATLDMAVARVAGGMPSLRAGEMGMTTSEVGNAVAHLLGEDSSEPTIEPGMPS